MLQCIACVLQRVAVSRRVHTRIKRLCCSALHVCCMCVAALLQCVAACCSVLYSANPHQTSVLHCVAHVLQHCDSVLQHVAVPRRVQTRFKRLCCSVLNVCCSVLQRVAACCSMLQCLVKCKPASNVCVAVCCTCVAALLQRIAVCCSVS